MDINKDYYKILEINKNATKAEIKKAYNKLVKIYHPDINKTVDAQRKITLINESNEVLSNEKNKNRYDRESKFGKNTFISFNEYFNSANVRDYVSENIIKPEYDVKRTPKLNPLDLSLKLNISLEEIYNNKDKKITYKRNCYDTLNNYVSNIKMINLTKVSFVEGKKIPIPNGGHQDRNNTNVYGTAYIEFEIINSPYYKKIKNDLYINYEIDAFELIKGGEIEILNLDNNLFRVKINKNTKPNSLIKISNKGFLIDDNNRGDLYIRLLLSDLHVNHNSDYNFSKKNEKRNERINIRNQ